MIGDAVAPGRAAADGPGEDRGEHFPVRADERAAGVAGTDEPAQRGEQPGDGAAPVGVLGDDGLGTPDPPGLDVEGAVLGVAEDRAGVAGGGFVGEAERRLIQTGDGEDGEVDGRIEGDRAGGQAGRRA